MNNQENYKCPNCGGNLKMGINNDILCCKYCGFEKRNNDEKQEPYTEIKKVNKEGFNDNESKKYDLIITIASLIATVLILMLLINKM